MKDYFSEFIIILMFSKKTQYAIILGAVGYMVINLVGEYKLHDFHLSGYLEPLSDVVKDKLLGKYDKAALSCLVSFWLLFMKIPRRQTSFRPISLTSKIR
jgi:hypothetical protein